MSCFDAGKPRPTAIDYLSGGLSRKQLATYFDAEVWTNASFPIDQHIARMSAGGEHATVARRQLMNGMAWTTSRTVRTILIERGIGDVMFSLNPLSETLYSGLAIFRFTDSPPFGDFGSCPQTIRPDK